MVKIFEVLVLRKSLEMLSWLKSPSNSVLFAMPGRLGKLRLLRNVTLTIFDTK